MNDPWTISASNVISLLATAVVVLGGFVVKKLFDKVEKLDAEAVRKRELKELQAEITQGRRETNEETQKKLDDIKDDIREIYKMLNRGGR